jgi:hypothetical protein
MADRRSADELRAVAESAWPEIDQLLRAGPRPVRVLAASESRRDVALEAVQVTVASFLGALVGECGGLAIDDGWLRILGAGADGLPGVHQASTLAGEPAPHLDIAWDVLGGRFAVNGGGLPAPRGEVCYFGPDTLAWTGIGGGHSAFVRWALSGGMTDFYASLRWPGWREEVAELALDQGLSLCPPPFTAEGRDLSTTSRRPVALSELHAFYASIAAQTADLPDGGTFRITTGD